MIGDVYARRLRFGFTRVTNMRMNVLYITLLGSDAQESRGSFCKNYVIKMIEHQSFRAYTESIYNTRCFVLTYLSSMEFS